MSKKCYRYYGGLLGLQQKWLNKMAGKGYQLVRTTKAMYEFEPCAPGQYQYCVEFVGEKSKRGADDYVRFLEDCGYRVFYKNINLDYTMGKVRFRPWAGRGGKTAVHADASNGELLIVEKVRDGKPFELHTTYEDKQRDCKNRRKPWLFLFVWSAAAGVIFRQKVWWLFAAVALAALIAFQVELTELKKQGKIQE